MGTIHMGAFIVFEGVEGSGKSTQSKALIARLDEAKRACRLIREPGGTPIGERIRDLLQGEDYVSPLAELFLFNAARATLVDQVLRPALEANDIVVCDRYVYSTVAYQGYGRGLELDQVHDLNRIATSGLVPDLVVLLDLAPDQGFQRLSHRPLDRIEQEAGGFHQRVRRGYLELSRSDPDRWLVLDAVRPVDELSDAIWGRTSQILRNNLS